MDGSRAKRKSNRPEGWKLEVMVREGGGFKEEIEYELISKQIDS